MIGTELFTFLPYGADQKNQLYLCFTQCIKTGKQATWSAKCPDREKLS